MSQKPTVLERIYRLRRLVDDNGFDRVLAVSGLSVSSLANYLKISAKSTIGHNTLKLLELELKAMDHEPSANIR